MASPWHNLLNRALPMGVRKSLRQAAGKSIPSLRHLDMPARLRTLARLGFRPAVIYDIGAAEGEWARLIHTIWPAAAIVGFEPNATRVAKLDAAVRELSGRYSYHRCFLGPSAGEVRYADQQDQTSLMMPEENAKGAAVAPMKVVDELIAAGQIPAPDFLKLDVQGFELEVLKGATKALDAAQAVLLEVSFARFSPGMPIYSDVLDFMHRANFRWYDIAGIYRRHSDDALGQLDMLFLKNGHPLIKEGLQ